MHITARGVLSVLGALGVLLALILALCADGAETAVRVPEPVQELGEGWYRMERGERVPVEVPGVLTLEKGTTLVLYNDALRADDAGMSISFRGAVYLPEVYMGEDLLYRYSESGFVCNEQMRSKLNCVVRLPFELTGEALRIVLYDMDGGRFELPKVAIGPPDAILRDHVEREGANVFLTSIMLLMGLLSLVVYVSMCRIHMTDVRFLNVAIFLILCALWCITDSPLVPELVGSYAATYYISFYCFMSFSIPIIHFVRETATMNHYHVLNWLEGLFYINIAAQTALHLAGACDMVDMLWATHILLFGGVAALCVLLCAEYRRTKNVDLRNPMIAFGLLGAGGVLALALYWLPGVPFYGLIYELGILVFIICLLWTVVNHTVNNLSFRIESRVYRRLSMIDGLTGLSNRRSFDQFFEDLVGRVHEYENIALFFMDLNFLKDTNDRFGHNAGDELLIGAAHCIRRCFGESRDCYRIGGDEFAVVLINPEEGNMQMWSSRLDACIRQHNQNARYRLSIARGYSLLRDDQGRIKRFGDWKAEADQAMYQNKLAQRENL